MSATERLYALVALVVIGLPLFGCSPAPHHPDLLLITIDAMRASDFGANVAGTPLTPNLSELAAKGVVFTSASSVASETSPGIAGILTGLLPFRTGVLGNRNLLPPSIETLATDLADAGYQTAGFVANPVLAARYGFGRGFQSFEVVPPQADEPKARARQVFARALRFLRHSRPDRPRFLWLHLFEPHGPYRPPADAVSPWDVSAFTGPTETPLCPPQHDGGFGCIPSYQQAVREPSHDSRTYSRNYAGEIRDLDRAVGEFLREPTVARQLPGSVLIVTADHGEAMAGDHGFFFSHGHPLYQDQVAVPLFILAPGLGPGAVNEPVSTVDILATTLALLHLPTPKDTDGIDLFSRSPGVVAGDSTQGSFFRSGGYKLLFPAIDAAHPQLFDLAVDPMETTDLASRSPDTVRRLLRSLGALRSREVLAHAQKRPEPDPETAHQLRSLGYL